MTTLFIIAAILLFNNQFLVFRRQVYYNKLDVIYAQMELYLIKNEIHIDNSIAIFLTKLKNINENKGLLDIQILLALLHLVPKNEFERNRRKSKKLFKDIPEGLINLLKEYDRMAVYLIFYSCLKPDFIALSLYKAFKNIAIAIYEEILGAIVRRTIKGYIVILVKSIYNELVLVRDKYKSILNPDTQVILPDGARIVVA